MKEKGLKRKLKKNTGKEEKGEGKKGMQRNELEGREPH